MTGYGASRISVSVAALTDVLRQDQPSGACWPWAGPVNNRTGYGRFTFNSVSKQAHRIVYELLVGPIPDGFTVDHVCHNEALTRGECVAGVCDHRRCVNPAHLEAVPNVVNVLRGGSGLYKVSTHCGNGHPLDAGNSFLRIQEGRGVHGGGRRCRICWRKSKRAWKRARYQQAQGSLS